jgi:hypothetical protein
VREFPNSPVPDESVTFCLRLTKRFRHTVSVNDKKHPTESVTIPMEDREDFFSKVDRHMKVNLQ